MISLDACAMRFLCVVASIFLMYAYEKSLVQLSGTRNYITDEPNHMATEIRYAKMGLIGDG